MKKFALVMICSLIIIVLIAFNYLLWDRENKKQQNASNNASITVLGERINTLTENNQALQSRIKTLEEDLEALGEEHKAALEELEEKREIIGTLKENVNAEFLHEPINKWVEALNNGDFESAYMLEAAVSDNEDKASGLEEYIRNYKNVIESMEIESIELVTEGIPEDMIGEFIFRVTLEVVKVEGSPENKGGFSEGINKRYITVGFDREKDILIIKNISPVL
jgi:cell division protein FtsB